ncbi:hypothetical protein NEFER03_0334 [Nematocida sp. LUAm3]|nr:hypothetical protein NEFER03_0334 [Nematocida sp. LUAm3]KAI5173786.1 hypothetical protein NEFER02_0302 [Nematocida sp. LUAm2]KAI5177009.1 hypothetical protein NEFER01_0334 [Nematocida sp. LUAm1]
MNRKLFWASIDGESQEETEERLQKDLKYIVGEETEETLELLNLIVDALPNIEEPLFSLDALSVLLKRRNLFSIPAAKGVLLLISEYGAELSSFQNDFIAILTEDLLMQEYNSMDKSMQSNTKAQKDALSKKEASVENTNKSRVSALLCLCDILLRSEGLSLGFTREILKKLAYLSMRLPVMFAGRCLLVISKGVALHKNVLSTCYKDPNYLHEIDALKSHPILGEYTRKVKGRVAIADNIEEDILNRIEKDFIIYSD